MENEEIPVDGEISDMSVDDFAEALLVNDEAEDDADTDQPEDLEAAEDAGDDEPDEEIDPDEEDQEEDTEEPVFDVTIDGQSKPVPLSELTSGYLRQADYTRKTMELADTRRQAEATQAQYTEKQQQLETELTKWAVQSSQEPDWVNLSQKLNPQQFQVAQARWMQHKQKVEGAKQQLEQIRQEHHADVAGKLYEAVPEWRDDQVVQQDMLAMAKHAETYGFTYQEMIEAGRSDHRIFLLLRDVVKGQKAQKAAGDTQTAAQKRVAKASKPAPQRGRAEKGQSQKVARQKSLDALRRHGSDENFASWLLT